MATEPTVIAAAATMAQTDEPPVLAGFDAAPPLWRYSAALLVLVAELALVGFLAVTGVAGGNTTAQAWLPWALATVGLHQANSPTAVLGGK